LVLSTAFSSVLAYSSVVNSQAIASTVSNGNGDKEDFERENSIHTWGWDLEDGILTFYIDKDIAIEKQNAVRRAIEEWDNKILALELKEVLSHKTANIVTEFNASMRNSDCELAG
jgi:hypothetical protein